MSTNNSVSRSASASSSASSPGSRSSSRRARLDRLRRLTARDHQLLRWLAEHYVLSTDQITTALFPSRRSARLRLAQLHQMEAVSRFVDVTTGSGQYLYTLGPLGTVVHPTQFNDPNRAGGHHGRIPPVCGTDRPPSRICRCDAVDRW